MFWLGRKQTVVYNKLWRLFCVPGTCAQGRPKHAVSSTPMAASGPARAWAQHTATPDMTSPALLRPVAHMTIAPSHTATSANGLQTDGQPGSQGPRHSARRPGPLTWSLFSLFRWDRKRPCDVRMAVGSGHRLFPGGSPLLTTEP